ncbi:DUF4349 domain-containing protein [Planococcus sp. APC 4015]|nr:DUF4349 domain-containing protein [Planococcus sp. APC 4015]
MNTIDPRLPELAADRIDDIEDALFADIRRVRDDDRVRRARRGRLWMAGGAAAAVIAVAAIIAPSVGGLLTPANEAGSAVAPATSGDVAFDGGEIALEGNPVELDGSREAGSAATDEAPDSRDIITTASATVTVEDPAIAAREVGDAAVSRGGYVESMNVGTASGVVPIDPGIGGDSMTYPYQPEGAWVTVRVPTDALAPLIDDLAQWGEVTASTVNRQDVTTQTIDLEARVASAQASVDRLTQLMGEAGSLADLIAAEAALSERQAVLESSQQQLEMLEDQVAMSTLTVSLTPETETVAADPAGFGDGIAAGWNGLVATLNGIVIAVGFLLPWLGVIGVLALIVWGIRRAVKTRRSSRVRVED